MSFYHVPSLMKCIKHCKIQYFFYIFNKKIHPHQHPPSFFNRELRNLLTSQLLLFAVESLVGNHLELLIWMVFSQWEMHLKWWNRRELSAFLEGFLELNIRV